MSFGIAPFGTYPFGLSEGTSEFFTLPTVIASVGIDPVAQDYNRNSDGELQSMTPLRQRVLLALGTRKSELFFDTEFGDDFPNLDRMPADPQQVVQRFTESALAHLIDEGSVQLVRVRVEQEGGTIFRLVEWKDLTTGESREEQL